MRRLTDPADRRRPRSSCCSPSCACPPSSRSGRSSPRNPTRKAGRRHASSPRSPSTRSPSAAAAASSATSPRPGCRPARPSTAFDFEAVPMLSARRRSWRSPPATSGSKTGANLLLFGPPGGGKVHLAAALGLALVENGWRVLFTRTTDLVQRLQIARRELALEAAIAKLDKLPPADPRRHRLRHQGPGRNQRPVRADRRPLRAALAAHHRQPALRRMGQDLPGPGHDARRRRPPRPPRHDLRDERRELSPRARRENASAARQSRPPATMKTRLEQRDNQLHAQRQSGRDISDNQKSLAWRTNRDNLLRTIGRRHPSRSPAAVSPRLSRHTDCLEVDLRDVHAHPHDVSRALFS